MGEEQKQAVWVVVTTHTQERRLGLAHAFANEADARRMAADFNKAHMGDKTSQHASVFRCEVK